MLENITENYIDQVKNIVSPSFLAVLSLLQDNAPSLSPQFCMHILSTLSLIRHLPAQGLYIVRTLLDVGFQLPDHIVGQQSLDGTVVEQ
jgi:hypothetical protein